MINMDNTGEEQPTCVQISAVGSWSTSVGNQRTFRQASPCWIDIHKLHRNGALEECLDKHWLTACRTSTRLLLL